MATAKNLNRSEKLVKILGVGAMITLLGGLGVSYVGYSQIEAARQQLEQQRASVEQAREAPDNLQKAMEEYVEAQKELRYLEEGVSEAAYVPTLLKQLEVMATGIEMEIQSVRPAQKPQASNNKGSQDQEKKEGESGSESSKPYEEQIIQVSVKGNFWSVMSFLKRVQAFPKILSVQRMSLQSKLDPGQTTNPPLETQIEIRAYIFKQPAKSEKAAQNRESESAVTPNP